MIAKHIAAYGAFLLTCLAAQSTSVKHIYVEPFAMKTSSQQLRDELILSLRKIPGVSLVSSESGAELVLGGGGEIWVKGYRSLNPRSGTSTANGTPVYGGYLAVELRDAKGETQWSDLVTPGTDSEDVEKDLSRSIARHIAAELARHTVTPPAEASQPQPQTVLKGAGATFPAPVYSKWFLNYRHDFPNREIDYDPVGSEAGIRALLAGAVDFGASDSPEAIHALSPKRESGFLLFPSVVGAVVPISTFQASQGKLLSRPKRWPVFTSARSRSGTILFFVRRIAAFICPISISSSCTVRMAAAQATHGPIIFRRLYRIGNRK